jgi:raffinose/stachyose/melibiose transport system substrate-binding protein
MVNVHHILTDRRKYMQKKFFVLVALILVALNACGKKPSRIDLVFFSGHGDMEQGITELIREYESLNPSVKITAIYNSKDYSTQFQSMIATNTLPDIAMVDQERLRDLVKMDLFLDLSERPVAANLYDVAKAPNSVDGRLYAVSFHLQGYGLLYNPDLLKNAAIAQPPKTVAELAAASAKLKESGVTPFTSMFNEEWACDQYLLFGISPALNVHPELTAGLMAGTVKFTNPAFMTVFDYIDILKKNVPEQPFAYAFGEGASYLAQEKAAMAVHGDWILRTALEVNPNLNVRMVGLPVSDNANDQRIIVGVANGMGIIKGSKHLEEAGKFFDYITSAAAMQTISKYNHAFSPINGFDTSGLHPVYEDINIAMKNGKAIPWEWLGVAPGGVKLEAGKSMQAYLNDQNNKEQVLENIQKALDMALNSQ